MGKFILKVRKGRTGKKKAVVDDGKKSSVIAETYKCPYCGRNKPVLKSNIKVHSPHIICTTCWRWGEVEWDGDKVVAITKVGFSEEITTKNTIARENIKE